MGLQKAPLWMSFGGCRKWGHESTMRDNEGVRVWVLADDRAGNVAQALGVAEALGWPFAVKRIGYTRLAALPNALRGYGLTGLDEASRAALSPPWPEVVIGAGRRTAPVARWLKRRSGALLVQVMDPGFPGRNDFDLIAIPNHDWPNHTRPRPSANVIAVTGAPHRVTPQRLAAAAGPWQPRFSHLPRPWIALSVGGATRQRPFPSELAGELGRDVADLARSAGGAVLATTSRRTGTAQEEALLSALDVPRFVHRFGQEGDNPYFAFLALADAVVVTGDSVSMACEACATPGPVHIFAPPGWAAPKHARLHAELAALGLARALEPGMAFESWAHPPLNAAGVIADAIRRLVGT